MKVSLQRLIACCLSVIFITSPVAAQKKPVRERAAAKPDDTESQSLRKQQLRILHEGLLSRTVDSLKNMDEVALRLSARNQILTYLWETKVLTDRHLTLKKNLVLDSIADLTEHHHEIPPFMLDYLSADLAALVDKYQPDVAEKLKAANETAKSAKQAVSIRSLFELNNGDALGATRIRQLLAQGQDVKELNFWLADLRRQRSPEFEPLLRDVIAAAERGPQISFETLLWLNPICFQPEVPQPLRRSFAAMILSRTQPANFAITPAPQSAYELLSGALPFIQEVLPERYEQAVGQSLVLRTNINQAQLATEERAKRLKESQTPIDDLVQEAEAAKTKNERNELLAEAAELALRKEQFAISLDIVAKLDLEFTIPGQTGFWRNWKSQFLRKLVRTALTANQPEIAEKAAWGMTASLAKVQSLALIMSHWNEAADKGAARRLLIEAITVSSSIPDETEKAKAFLLLTINCDQVDESRKSELLLSSLKSLNAVNKPTTPRDQTPYQEYVRSMDSIGHPLNQGFKALTTKDENAAIGLVVLVHKSDLRTFALIGILAGLTDLLAKAEA
jgi:hypothetical protein